MTLVKFSYIPVAETIAKEATFGVVNRFAETYTSAAKNLSIQLKEDVESGYVIQDIALAELVHASIDFIELIEKEDDDTVKVIAHLTDYAWVLDIRKDYSANGIATTFSFKKNLIDDTESNETESSPV
jgi:hypothetical protein